MDDQVVFYDSEAESIDDSIYKLDYDVAKGNKEGYYLISDFNICQILLPVDSKYVKRLKAYRSNAYIENETR